jgi:hypothetical protein
LEAFPRTGLTGFLALLHPRIAPEQSLGLERSAKIRVHQQERPRNGEPRSASLAGSATAGGVDGEIVGVRQLHYLQWLKHRVLQGDRREIILKAFPVDVDLTAAGRHSDPRDRRFAATGGDEFLSLGHEKILRLE